jgi:HAD superfamily hydrolase (TIGR01509 family)
MIRNVVFDLGNVLLSFLPEQYLEKLKYPPEKRRVILNDIFAGPEWRSIDNGDISTEEAIDKIASHSSLKRAEIAAIFDLRHEILFSLDSNVKIIPELKKMGYRLYYISNFPADLFDRIKDKYSLFSYFDGGIISSHVKLSKPDIRIFEYFLNKFEINAKECLFIDDLMVNTEAASNTGMHTMTTLGSADFGTMLFSKLCKLR